MFLNNSSGKATSPESETQNQGLATGMKGNVAKIVPFRFLSARSASLLFMKATKPQFLSRALSSSVLGHMILTLASGPYRPNSWQSISSFICETKKKKSAKNSDEASDLLWKDQAENQRHLKGWPHLWVDVSEIQVGGGRVSDVVRARRRVIQNCGDREDRTISYCHLRTTCVLSKIRYSRPLYWVKITTGRTVSPWRTIR